VNRHEQHIDRKRGVLEIVDVGDERTVARIPIGEVLFLPRVGERIFLPGKTLGE
jgi:hypothetical protein